MSENRCVCCGEIESKAPAERKMSIAEMLQSMANDICTDYCRFPYIKTEEELNEICDKCPLNILFGGV